MIATPGRALALAMTSLALACAAAPARAASTVEVDITRFAFAPKEVTVAPGTRVVWTNRDETPHTIAAGDRSFSSKGLDTGDAYEHTFAAEGDYAYVCTVHPFMTGVVHVKRQ